MGLLGRDLPLAELLARGELKPALEVMTRLTPLWATDPQEPLASQALQQLEQLWQRLFAALWTTHASLVKLRASGRLYCRPDGTESVAPLVVRIYVRE